MKFRITKRLGGHELSVVVRRAGRMSVHYDYSVIGYFDTEEQAMEAAKKYKEGYHMLHPSFKEFEL